MNVRTLSADLLTDNLRRRLEEKLGPPNERGCREWTGGRNTARRGYGFMDLDGKPHGVHRIAWALANGRWARLCVLHSCDNPPCCEPSHLSEGTQARNIKDMYERGRASLPPRHFGLANSNAHLSDEQIAEVRLRVGEKQRDLADEYGVSQSTIWRILHGQTRVVA